MSGPAAQMFGASAPVSPDAHLVGTGQGVLLLIPDGTRIYDIDEQTAAMLDRARRGTDRELAGMLEKLGLRGPGYVDDAPPPAPPVRALSLAVAQKCNLGCTYCYAQQGSFGGPARQMPDHTALRAVELLFGEVGPGERVNLSFLGGEPLLNRATIHAATERALALAAERGAQVGFSITTNGTRLGSQDADFFEEHGFAVTVSLDGVGATNDALRPFRSGRGTFEAVMANVAPLLRRQRRMQVSARVTVTPRNLELAATLEHFIALGFHSVGFSPLLRSPTGRQEMGAADLEAMLAQMIDCARECERRVIAGERYPFANMINALRELHRGTHRPYPCGAGAGYLGVSAEGELAACHRFVGDEDGGMGDLAGGVDRERQARWLATRHVHRQSPCRECWARYMCGGGCHHEVIRRGRPACDYIRGWLHHCIGAYGRLLSARPDYFTGAPDPPAPGAAG